MKRLTRTRVGGDRMIGGVCGGIARYWSQSREEADMDTATLYEVDPAWVRLGWAAITLFSVGAGIIAYLICWVLIPEE